MAYTERYVTDAADGGSAGTEGDPWTLADALTNAVAGDRVNILSDSGYALGADSITNAGTFSQMICFRGYNSSIGDLENLGWNADGTLNVTNFPIITLSGILDWSGGGSKYHLLQNLVFTGSLSSRLVGDGSGNKITVIECKFTNTANNTAAQCVLLNNDCKIINCDLECTGAAHGAVLRVDVRAQVIGCRIKGLDAGVALMTIEFGAVIGNLLQGGGSTGIGVKILSGLTTNEHLIYGNTIVNCEKAIEMPNIAPTDPLSIINNHGTDNAEWLDNLYSGTANIAVIEVNNRTRDNTTLRTGIGDGANIGEVTTDTGGASTDYTNAGSNDFTLISAAPGKATGMRKFTDIGAYQREEPAGGGGGGGGKQAGAGGGQVG